MTIKKALQLFSFGLLLYLLVDITMQIDFAATKNLHLVWKKKLEIEKNKDIDSVKRLALHNIDIGTKNRKDRSQRSSNQLIVIGVLLISEISILSIDNKKQKA